MNILRYSTIVLMCSMGPAFGADPEIIPYDKLPEKVKEAVKAKYPDWKVVGVEKTVEDGETTFDVEFAVKGKTIEVTFTEEGMIEEIRKEITLADLPKLVSAALSKKYPRARHEEFWEVTEGEEVTYNIVLRIAQGRKKVDVTFDPKGTIVEEEITGAPMPKKK